MFRNNTSIFGTMIPEEGENHEDRSLAMSHPRPTVDDTLEVRYILLNYLPLELVDVIIEAAEYYPSLLLTYPRSDMLKVSASQFMDYDATYCCLITPPIPVFGERGKGKVVTTGRGTGHMFSWLRSKVDSLITSPIQVSVQCAEKEVNTSSQGIGRDNFFQPQMSGGGPESEGNGDEGSQAEEERPAPAVKKVKKVRFLVRGHDQGWVTVEGSIRGTYRGAKSWWEALILRPNEASLVQTRSPDLSDVGPFELRDNSIFQEHNLVEVAAHGTKRWVVQRNVVASSTLREYTVVWKDDDCETVEGKELSKGCGCGTGFLGALKPGDRIAVLARAKEWGWENHVHGVSVEIMYSI